MKPLTLDAVAEKFPDHAIEVSRASDTGQPPGKWRARLYRHSEGRGRTHEGATQDEALRGMLRADLDSAREWAASARKQLASAEEHLREREAVLVALLDGEAT